MPGPEGIKTMYKIGPAVVTCAGGRNIGYKALTSKHNTDHSEPYVQKDLSRNYVYMQRVDENGVAIDNSAPMPTCYDHLNFVGVSDCDWGCDSYIAVAQRIYQPDCAPRRYLGRLFDMIQRARLLKFKQEGDRREDASFRKSLHQQAPQADHAVAARVISLVFHTEHILTTVV